MTPSPPEGLETPRRGQQTTSGLSLPFFITWVFVASPLLPPSGNLGPHPSPPTSAMFVGSKQAEPYLPPWPPFRFVYKLIGGIKKTVNFPQRSEIPFGSFFLSLAGVAWGVNTNMARCLSKPFVLSFQKRTQAQYWDGFASEAQLRL